MMKTFGIQLKPVGNSCNLKCKYCYVKPFMKEKLTIMPDNILDAMMKQLFMFQKNISISWHGGEPTLPGLSFYKKVVKSINKYKTDSHKVTNMIQTNATLLTPEFAKFFKDNEFAVSISLDGPEHIHNLNRINKNNYGSFKDTMRGLEILRVAGLKPPVIATVTKDTVKFAKETFRFLIDNDFTDIKFSPVYDSVNDCFSIGSDQWFEYLKDVFYEWLNTGNPDISVRELDEVIAWLSNKPIRLCSGNQGCQKCAFIDLCRNGCPATRVLGGRMAHDGVYVYCEQMQKLFKEIKSVFDK